MKDKKTVFLIFVVVASIIYILARSVSIQPGQPLQPSQAVSTDIIKISYLSDKNIVIDCSVSDNLCLFTGDTAYGWVNGFVEKKDLTNLSSAAGQLKETNDTKNVFSVLTQKGERRLKPDENAQTALSTMSEEALASVKKIESTALQSERVKDYIKTKKQVVTFISPATYKNAPAWLVSFGSQIDPDEQVYVNFDGSKILE